MANRTSNSIKNIASNLGLKLLLIGLQFATRTIFINSLGTIYNGINSLITSILSFLNITELGIGSAIVFAMYKPVADGDEEKTLQYLSYYRKIYHLLGFIVAGIGALLAPFLPFLMRDALGEISLGEIYVVYGLYLLSSVSSFFVYAYRGGLITANQQDYRLTHINYTASVLIVVAQGVSLLVFDGIFGFYVYVALPIVISIARSILNGIFAARWYPYIRRKPEGRLSKAEKKALYKNVYGIAISKTAAIINNSVDSIIISALVGVALLGKYYNYQTLILMVGSFVGILFSSLTPSVGNLNAEASKEHKKKIFDTVHFISFWIYGFCAVCYFLLVQPFVRIWIGEQNVLYDVFLIFVVSLNFYTNGLCSAVGIFREGCGLFYQGRYRPIFTVLFNVGFSILLGYFLGITGIVLATVISRFITIWWYDAYIVYKYQFERKPYRYLADYVMKMIFVCLVGYGLYIVCELLPFGGWLQLGFNALIAIFGFNLVFILCFCKTRGFKYVMEFLSRFIRRTKRQEAEK